MKQDLFVHQKVSNPLSHTIEPGMNYRRQPDPRILGNILVQLGSDSAQPRIPLRNLPKRSGVSEHHISPKANSLALQVISMVK